MLATQRSARHYKQFYVWAADRWVNHDKGKSWHGGFGLVCMAREQKGLRMRRQCNQDGADISDRLFKGRLYYKPHCEGFRIHRRSWWRVQERRAPSLCSSWRHKHAAGWPEQRHRSCPVIWRPVASTPAADQRARPQLSNKNRSLMATRFKTMRTLSFN